MTACVFWLAAAGAGRLDVLWDAGISAIETTRGGENMSMINRASGPGSGLPVQAICGGNEYYSAIKAGGDPGELARLEARAAIKSRSADCVSRAAAYANLAVKSGPESLAWDAYIEAAQTWLARS